MRSKWFYSLWPDQNPYVGCPSCAEGHFLAPAWSTIDGWLSEWLAQLGCHAILLDI